MALPAAIVELCVNSVTGDNRNFFIDNYEIAVGVHRDRTFPRIIVVVNNDAVAGIYAVTVESLSKHPAVVIPRHSKVGGIIHGHRCIRWNACVCDVEVDTNVGSIQCCASSAESSCEDSRGITRAVSFPGDDKGPRGVHCN